MASLVVCGLFVAEDPVVIAVRARFDGSRSADAIFDASLAAGMIGYNFAASRFVVSITSAPCILEAMSALERQRVERIDLTRGPITKTMRRVVSHLNPFDLIKYAGDRIGRSLARATSAARRRRLYRFSAVLEDLTAVNLLGVPGAGLALASSGRLISRRHSLRHSVAFVASWFVGIRCIEWLLDQAREVPKVGPALSAVFGVVDALFSTLTDVRDPIGGVLIAATALVVLRYTMKVDRRARQLASGS